MELKSEIESLKQSVSNALISALKEKNEQAVSKLFDVYNSVNSIKVDNPVVFNFNTITNNIPCAEPYYAAGGDHIVFSSSGLDTISLG